MLQDRMTEYEMEELACPKCGHKHTLRKYKRINATQYEDMPDKILKNELFMFRCEECEFEAPLTYPCLYVDSKHRQVLYLAPVMTQEDEEEMAAIEKDYQGRMRLVDNINDFKEKIMIARNQLDDRVIEVIKIMYIAQLKKEMENDNMLDILFDYAGTNMCFIVFFEKKGIGRMPLSLEYYRGIAAQYDKKIREHSHEGFMKVDLEWAGKVLGTDRKGK